MSEARTAEEHFRLLVQSVKDYAIFMVTLDGRVATWNAGAEAIKGYRADEIIGQPISRFYSEQDVSSGRWRHLLQLAAEHGRSEDEGWRLRKDGTRFWANVILTAIRDATGRHIGFAKVTRDLTERKRLEAEELRRAQAEEALRLRDEFLSIASHELKTPLTSLSLQLEGLRTRIDSMDEKLALRLDRASRSSERLGELVELLLDVSRIASGNLQLAKERFDLADAATEAVESMRESSEKAGCRLTLRSRSGLMGQWDRLRIEQVITNLLSNAIKYAANTPVDVTLVRDGETAVLQVRDGGPGIAEEDLERIFGRFQRAAPMLNHGGLGLGLYISREIVVAHGGTIAAGNAPGGGAIFTVTLPLPAERQPAAGERH